MCPNWCYTNIRCTGNTDEIEDLYNRMNRLQEMPAPLKPNGFGTTWLGNLVEDLGVEYGKVSCRGSWDGLLLDGDILCFSTETAWYRCTEVEDLIKEKYPSIDIAFRCEEPGMCIYEKNNNVFFPEDYIVDIEDDDTYYLTEEDALQTLSDFFGIDFKDMDEAMVLVEENNENDDGRVWVNKYQLVE